MKTKSILQRRAGKRRRGKRGKSCLRRNLATWRDTLKTWRYRTKSCNRRWRKYQL